MSLHLCPCIYVPARIGRQDRIAAICLIYMPHIMG